MLDPASFAWLLLPLGVVLGWVMAHRLRDGHGDSAASESESAAAVPLEALSDSAVNAIGEAAEANPAFSELQLTLGAVFRRRGEVDRAIAVHQRLSANAAVSAAVRDSARHELAQDYLKAGLMDRAEALLLPLVEQPAHAQAALELLLSIHEQARDWPRAIEVVQRLQAVKAQDYGGLLAHYHCELAEQALEDSPDKAARLARRALDLCPSSVRASLLIGSIAEKAGDPVAALRAYRRVPEQDARFLSEVIEPLQRCSAAIDRPKMFVEFIEEAEQRLPQSGSVMLARARLIGQAGGDVAAYLARRLAQHPQWPGLLAWIDAQAGDEAGAASELRELRDALRKRLRTRPAYRCTSCGLTPSILFWQCPGCKHWDCVIPDEDRL